MQQLDIEGFTAFFILHLWNGGHSLGIASDWYAARMSRVGLTPAGRLFVRDAESCPLTWVMETDATEEATFRPVVTPSAIPSFLASLLASPAVSSLLHGAG